MRDPRYGWVVVATLATTVTVAFGVLSYAFAVLLLPMERDLGWSRTSLTGAYSVALLVSAGAGLVVGRQLDRRSPRLVMTLGAAAAAALVVAWSRVETLTQLYLVFAGMGLAMSTVLYTPVFTVVTKWFHHRRAAAITMVTLVGATASLVFSPLTQRLEDAYGWRTTLLVLAAILAVVAVPLHALVLRPAPAPTEPIRADRVPRTVIRSRPFLLLAAAFALADLAVVGTLVHLVALLVSGGRDAAFAAFVAGVAGISQLPGRAVYGLAAHRLRPSRRPLLVFVPLAASLALLAADRGTTAAFMFAVVFGAASGMGTVLGATLPADLWGRSNYGAIESVKAGAQNVARAAGPVVASALLVALPGGYGTVLTVFAFCVALSGIAAVAAIRSLDGPEVGGVAHPLRAF